MAAIQRYRLEQKGLKWHNGRGTVREVVDIHDKASHRDSVLQQRVVWKKVEGKGHETGVTKWATWRRWVKDEWLVPRPERLPVPMVNDAEMAFPTSSHTPPWRWVPDEFRNKPGGDYDNQQNPWNRCVTDLFYGHYQWDHWSGIPKENVDAVQAHRAICETLGSWNITHQRKIATAGWMMSEWFVDFWWKGDTHTVVHGYKLDEWVEGWEK